MATPPLNADPVDVAAVEHIVRAAGTSFYRGMRILPPDRRLAMYAIYAFCRVVDDIADEPAPLDFKHAGLADWRARIAGLYAGTAGDAVTRVLRTAASRFQLRQDDFLAVVDGMAMDADTVIVAPPLDTLMLYCDRVAGAVGRLSVRAFGDASPAADEVAQALGRALQLTNILRDLGEDAARGRLYLPREWLDEAGAPASVDALRSHGLPAVCARVAAEAERQFALARDAMTRCDRRAMRPARLMGATYAALLARLQRTGWSRPEERVSLPTWQKLWIALRYAR